MKRHPTNQVEIEVSVDRIKTGRTSGGDSAVTIVGGFPQEVMRSGRKIEEKEMIHIQFYESLAQAVIEAMEHGKIYIGGKILVNGKIKGETYRDRQNIRRHQHYIYANSVSAIS